MRKNMAYIREHKNKLGKVTFTAVIRLKGTPSQSSTFTRKTDAKRWIAKIETEIRENRNFNYSQSRKKTLIDATERYRTSLLPSYKDLEQKNRKYILSFWDRHIGNLKLIEIKPSHISELRDALMNGSIKGGKTQKKKVLSAGSVIRYINVLSHVLSQCVKEWDWLAINPVLNVKKPTAPKGRTRFLSDTERERLLIACKDVDNASMRQNYLYPIVVLALATGARRGEIINLTWKNVDFKHCMLRLYETKNGEIRSIPLVHHALDVIKELYKIRRIDTQLIFSRTDGIKPIEFRKKWEKAIKQADIKDFKFHDLRHTTASYLAMNGATLTEISAILGHKTLQMVKRYAHLTEQHTVSIMQRMNEEQFK